MSNPNTDKCEGARLQREFEDGLDALTRQCWRGWLYVREWRVLNKCLRQYPILAKTDPVLFDLAHEAIADWAIMIAARLVDERPEVASVRWLLCYAEKHPAIFPHRQNAVMTGVKADGQRLSELAPKIGKLMAIRHNYFAHLNRKHLMPLGKLYTKYPFSPDDAEELYEAIGGILNRYSGYLRGSATRMNAVIREGHTEWLLDFLSKALDAANTYEQAELQRVLDELYHITKKGLEIRRLDRLQPSTCRRRQAD